jgi:putative glutamine amidotransferase
MENKVSSVAMVEGSGTDIVESILTALGVKVNIITKLSQVACDYNGVMLLGGRDISPKWYGEGLTYSQAPDNDRDFIEWTLLRRAMNRRYPIFGICRGCQFIAVAHGGCLYQDLTQQKATEKNHTTGTHKLIVTRPFNDVIPTKIVNSLHHQGIRNVPDGFKCLATSDGDGIVEAIWKPGVLGVQFHPEFMIGQEGRWINLWRWFIDGLL